MTLQNGSVSKKITLIKAEDIYGDKKQENKTENWYESLPKQYNMNT